MGRLMGKPQPNGPAQFPEPKEVGPREWGRELMLFYVPGYFTFKRIEMTKGSKGGLQFHHKKAEGGVMVQGRMKVIYDPGDGSLQTKDVEEGDSFFFPQGCVHQTEALTNCAYVEVSTPYMNDRCHVEDLYGLDKEEGGLPSTKPSEVVELKVAEAVGKATRVGSHTRKGRLKAHPPEKSATSVWPPAPLVDD